MSFIIVDGERYALSIGDTILGGEDDELLATSSLAALPPFATVNVSPEGMATIGPYPEGPLLLMDGQPMREQPLRLAHGARLEVLGRRIVYGELRASGRTSPVGSATDSGMPPLSQEERPPASSGGRLVRADQSSSHPIGDAGLMIGRDPACDVVLQNSKASRNHARVNPSLTGYTLTDTSSNGVYVNGGRVDGNHRLGVGDVIRFGDEEFRFEGESATYEPAAGLAPPPHGVAGSPTPVSESEVTTPKGPLLATLEVITEGPLKAKRFRLESPVAHVGRADYNDVVLPEESVSGTHVMLMQREGKWHATDLGSRNGTYVDGTRVTEAALPGACELRVGNVRLVFRPLRATTSTNSTRGIVGIND